MPQVAQESERRSWSSQHKLAAQHRSLQHAVVPPSGAEQVRRQSRKGDEHMHTANLVELVQYNGHQAVQVLGQEVVRDALACSRAALGRSVCCSSGVIACFKAL